MGGPMVLTNGYLQFSFQGDVGIAYEIQASTNLATWQTLTSVTNTGSGGTFLAPVNDSQSQFYRMRLVQ